MREYWSRLAFPTATATVNVEVLQVKIVCIAVVQLLILVYVDVVLIVQECLLVQWKPVMPIRVNIVVELEVCVIPVAVVHVIVRDQMMVVVVFAARPGMLRVAASTTARE